MTTFHKDLRYISLSRELHTTIMSIQPNIPVHFIDEYYKTESKTLKTLELNILVHSAFLQGK